MKRSLLCLGVLMVLVITSGGRGLTQGAKTPKTDTPNITVASDAIYKTRADAEAAMSKLPSCNQ
jgi:hypothetical protein